MKINQLISLINRLLGRDVFHVDLTKRIDWVHQVEKYDETLTRLEAALERAKDSGNEYNIRMIQKWIVDFKLQHIQYTDKQILDISDYKS